MSFKWSEQFKINTVYNLGNNKPKQLVKLVEPGIGLDSNSKWGGALYSATGPLYDFGVLLQEPAQIGYCHVYHLLRIIDYSGLGSS